MRIANNTSVYGFLSSLNKSLQRQNKLQEQLSDGKIIHRPSDDPIRTIRSLRFNTNYQMNEQFTQNLKDAMSWMQNTDGALSNMGSVMQRVKELAIQAAAPAPDTSYEVLGTELDGLINTLIDSANLKQGDRFIFSGQQDKTQPLTREGDIVTYHGDANKISMRVNAGPASPDQDSVNLNAQEIFGPGMELFNHLIELKNQLKSGTPDLDWISNTAIANIDADYNRMLRQQSQLGVRMATYEMTQNMMEAQSITIMGDISGNEDLDIARAIIDFQTSDNVYRLALSVGARIIPPSLVDFLR